MSARSLPDYDVAAVRAHVEMLHALAAGVDGELVITAYGEDPGALGDNGKPGRRIPGFVRRYKVGDVDGMVAAVLSQQTRAHSNVYAPLHVLRPGLGTNERGGRKDVAAVFGLVVDADADKGEAPRRIDLKPSFVIESSPGNEQQGFVFDRPLPPDEAERLAWALKLATASDSGTGDVAHVWRIPGAVNWPNAAKVARGRPVAPVPVRMKVPWDGSRVTVAELERALGPWLSGPRTAAKADPLPLDDDDREPIELDELPDHIRDLVELGTVDGNSAPDRSAAFMRAVLWLYERGHGHRRIAELLETNPAGIAEKYDGRVGAEVERVCRKAAERVHRMFDGETAAASAKPTGSEKAAPSAGSEASGASSSADGGAAQPGAAAQESSPWPFRLVGHGVERLIERTDPKTGTTTRDWKWFCSRLEVAAYTRDADSDEWGRLLLVTDRDGRRKEWAMPMSMLAGDGVAYRERLLSLGVTLAPGKFGREVLHEYVSTARPAAKAQCVVRTGWHGGSFMFTDAAVQPAATAERIVLQNTARLDNAMRRAGSFDAWKQDVAALAAGNSRLVLALSAAFAAPLLYPVGGESGGFHLRGASSSGKSTALVVAGSAWGGGGVKGYLHTWRATSNGLEGVAATHCDALLCLDEMGQVDGREAGAIAYMLANGTGKQRSGRSGEARASAEWRLLFLSSGEIGLSDKMAEDGRGRRAAAGQEVRIVDIEADAGRGLGLFEDLHGFADGDAFARHLNAASREHHGHAARTFLEMLVADLNAAAPTVNGFVRQFVAEHCPAGADGQVSRVCGRFGIVAAAGDMATAFGILPWSPGEAQRAAARCFRDWLAARGGTRPAEERQALGAVRRFIEMHGGSRFEPLGDLIPRDSMGRPVDPRVVNRVGYRRKAEDGGTEYVVTPETWKSELCAGLDPSMVAKTLASCGLLAVGNDGKPQVKVRLPTAANSVRAYVIRAEILDGAQEAA